MFEFSGSGRCVGFELGFLTMITYTTQLPCRFYSGLEIANPNWTNQLWAKWHISNAMKPLPLISRSKLKQFTVKNIQLISIIWLLYEVKWIVSFVFTLNLSLCSVWLAVCCMCYTFRRTRCRVNHKLWVDRERLYPALWAWSKPGWLYWVWSTQNWLRATATVHWFVADPAVYQQNVASFSFL